MILKILGILDIFTAVCFWIFGIFGFISPGFIMILGLFLLVKGLIFITGFSIASVLDILTAIAIIIGSYIALPKILVIIVSLFLLQKGILSLMN